MELNQMILISSLIKKLPHSWFDFVRGLKQKSKNFSFDELLVALRIKENIMPLNNKNLNFKLRHMFRVLSNLN